MNEFQCIFCGKSINKDEEKVTSLLITTNWENEASQEDQQVFCHLSCLKTKCHLPENIYVDED